MVKVVRSTEYEIEIGTIKITTPSPNASEFYIRKGFSSLRVDWADISCLMEALTLMDAWHDVQATGIQERS